MTRALILIASEDPAARAKLRGRLRARFADESLIDATSAAELEQAIAVAPFSAVVMAGWGPVAQVTLAAQLRFGRPWLHVLVAEDDVPSGDGAGSEDPLLREVLRGMQGGTPLPAGIRPQARVGDALSSFRARALMVESQDELFEAAIAAVTGTLGVELAEILEVRRGGGCVVRASRGALRRKSCGQDECRSLVRSMGVLPCTTGTEDDPRRCARAWYAEHGVRSAVVTTLPASDGAFGTLAVYDTAGRSFSAAERAFLAEAAVALSNGLERLRARAALQAAEVRWRSLVERLPVGVAVVQDERYVLVNDAYARTHGLAPAALVGKRVGDSAPEPFRAAARAYILGQAAPEVLAGGFTYTRSQGQTVSIEGHAVPIEHDERPATLAVVTDVTERRRLQLQLMQADRMVSVGTLAAGVAHELNNPLAYVTANLRYIVSELGKCAVADPELRAAATDAADGAERMQQIVRDLKTFSRVDVSPPRPVGVQGPVEAALNIASHEIKHRARVERALESTQPVVAEEGRLTQVLVNLLVNAAQAIGRGAPNDNTIRVHTRDREDGRVEISVRDSGAGIAPEHLPRLFEPFFTTKPPGEGTGLGLPVCQNLVEAMGGTIEVESTPGAGTTFRVLLPGASQTVDPPAVAIEARPAVDLTPGVVPGVVPGTAVPATARVLLIDDEPLVLTALRRVLEPHHHVETVLGGEEALDALERYQANGTPPDLILCDLMMPGMTGAELYARVSVLYPALAERFIFISGGAVTPAVKDFVEQLTAPLLHKPVHPTGLRTFLAQTLNKFAQ